MLLLALLLSISAPSREELPFSWKVVLTKLLT